MTAGAENRTRSPEWKMVALRFAVGVCKVSVEELEVQGHHARRLHGRLEEGCASWRGCRGHGALHRPWAHTRGRWRSPRPQHLQSKPKSQLGGHYGWKKETKTTRILIISSNYYGILRISKKTLGISYQYCKCFWYLNHIQWGSLFGNIKKTLKTQSPLETSKMH